MARKNATLLMTIGTGTGEDKIESAKSLAHGLLFSIDSQNPDKVVFFGSEESLITLDFLKEQYLEKYGEEFVDYEFIDIGRVDSFEMYFDAFKNKIDELKDDKITIDYTSGTKTMTMSAAFASMLFRKTLIFVSGRRENGTVIKRTEKIISQNLYPVYDDLMISKIKELFNSNRFEAGKVLLNDIVGANEDKEVFLKLFEAYGAFDNVDYEYALENFDVKLFKQNFPELSKQFEINVKALNILNTKNHGLKCYYILASMLNNARRRSEEHKFDDAIARLYRSLELIAQIKLKEYEITTSDVDISKLKGKVDKDYLNELESNRDFKSGKIRIGLTQDFILLNKLKDDLGSFYIENENIIQNSLKYRNNSILAHGLQSQNQDQYDEFRGIVLKAAQVLKSYIENYINETVFPEFEY